MPCVRNNSKVSYKCLVWSGRSLDFKKHIIDINLHGFTYQGSEYFGHHPLISCPCVFQTKRHYVIAVKSMERDKGCFLHVKRVHRNLMVSEEGV